MNSHPTSPTKEKNQDLHNVSVNEVQKVHRSSLDLASNKNWIEYLAKSRDGIEKVSIDNLNEGRRLSKSIAAYSASPSSDKGGHPIASSANKLPSDETQISNKYGSGGNFDAVSKSLLEVAGSNQMAKSSSSVDKGQNGNFLQIKVLEIPSESAIDAAILDYKTVSVSPDATICEFLLIILRKWRYLDPKQPLEFANNRPIITDGLRNFVENEGWELVLFQTSRGATGHIVVPLKSRIGATIQAVDKTSTPDFGFRRATANPILKDHQKNAFLEPCYVLKLDSQYPHDQVQTDSTVDIKNWAKRFLLLAKNRYLLLFKTENHARWIQNVIHEIDFARVMTLEMLNIVVADSSNLITLKGSDNVIAKFALKLTTRTRVIVFACVAETDRDRLFRQLNDVIAHVSVRKDHLQKFNHDRPFNARMESSKSFEITISPMIKLLTRLEQSKKLNAIDLPPFDYDPQTTEWLSWTIATNHSLFLTVKQLAHKQLSSIFSEGDLPDVQELLGYSKESSHEMSKTLSGDRTDNTGMVTSVRRFLKGLAVQPSSNSLGVDTHKSNLFGIPLDELSQRYDLSGLGIPVLPPVVTTSLTFLREKGLLAGGLFRIAGSVKRMDLLKKAYEKLDELKTGESDNIHGSVQSLDKNESSSSLPFVIGGEIDFSPYNVHDVAGVLKLFLRDLPDPILTSKLYRAFLSSEKLKDSFDKQIQMLKYLVMLLPPINRHLLEVLLEFLSEVVDNSEDKIDPTSGETLKGNLMTSTNLAVCLGPNILRETKGDEKNRSSSHSRTSSFVGESAPGNPSVSADDEKKQELLDSTAVVNVVKLMIENYRTLFTFSPEFLEEMKKLSSFSIVAPSKRLVE